MAAVWLLHMEESPLHSGLLTDDMGLRKTLSSILLIILSAQICAKRASDNLDSPPPVYRPTLIVCPSSAIATWKNELVKHAPHLPLTFYMGTERTTSLLDRAATLLSSPGKLRKYINSLAKDNPATATTIILTTYSTWLKRTLYEDTEIVSTPHRKA